MSGIPAWQESVRQVAPEWAEGFALVAREWFVPRIVWQKNPHGRGWLAVDRQSNPDIWNDLVARDESVITQVDDGRPCLPGGVGRAITSSTSMPTVMAVMLHALDTWPGHRVLEIGTGTGWNAAILVHRLGDDAVTTVEIDPVLAEQARAALDAIGFSPTVICGDGEHGYPPNAPYDRVLCTAGCRRVPSAWVAQCVPGGLIVTPWETPYLSSALLRLVVAADGTASGYFVERASFMSLRGQRVGSWIPNPDREPDVAERMTTLHPYEPISDYNGCAFAVSLLVDGMQQSIAFDDPADRRTYEVLVYDESTQSWATINVTPAAMDADTYPVRQYGPRRLWDEIEAAHQWWEQHQRPKYTEFGLTVGPDGGQYPWLREPDQRIKPITPTAA